MSPSEEQIPGTLGADYGAAKNVPQPTVGRIVHVYVGDPLKQSNGQGAGPYAAMVTQVIAGSDYINLTVFPPLTAPYPIGSVSHAAVAQEHGYSTYWEWPPTWKV